MKRMYLFVGVMFASVVSFMAAGVAVVVDLAVGLVDEFRDYIGVVDRLLSALVVMMYSVSVSGAVFIGNRVFGRVGDVESGNGGGDGQMMQMRC